MIEFVATDLCESGLTWWQQIDAGIWLKRQRDIFAKFSLQTLHARGFFQYIWWCQGPTCNRYSRQSSSFPWHPIRNFSSSSLSVLFHASTPLPQVRFHVLQIMEQKNWRRDYDFSRPKDFLTYSLRSAPCLMEMRKPAVFYLEFLDWCNEFNYSLKIRKHRRDD